MAYTELTDGISRATFRTRINTNFRDTSLIYPTKKSLNLEPIELDGNGCEPFELINIGNPGFVPQGTETRNLVPVGITRIGGNLLILRNIAWDQANLRWTTPFEETDAYGSGMIEMGGEGINMQVSPPGEQFWENNGERMVFSFRQSDARGVPGYTTGPVNHAMAPFFMHYATPSYQTGKLRSWIPSTSTSPLVYLHTDELKGTVGTFNVNELLKLESNSSTAGAYAGFNFANSNGSLASRSAVSTNKVVGQVGSYVYDGVTDQKTAEIHFITRGTISSGNAGQSIKFNTSPTNTAGLLTRFEISNDGALKNYAPIRYDVGTITTIPDYTGNGYAPALSTGTVMQIQPASTVNGGMLFQGFSVSGTNTAAAMIFRGAQGHTSPTGANTVFIAVKHNGTTNFTGIAAGEIGFEFRNNATAMITVLGSGNTGHLVAVPTAVVHVAASSTARASLCLNPGAAPTSPVNGDIWIDSTAHTMHVRINGVTKSINLT